MRKFSVVEAFADQEINLPVRKTSKSAGYDFECAKETYIHPKAMIIVPTGIKAYMEDDEYLDLRMRSGLSTKHQMLLINGAAVVDADYADNVDNEGHIQVPIYNLGLHGYTIAKGERIAQGVFTKFLTVDGDEAEGERIGGFGSSGTGLESTGINESLKEHLEDQIEKENLTAEEKVVAKAFAESGIKIVKPSKKIK